MPFLMKIISFQKKIADKVKDKFIKMASIGIVKKETSTEKKHLKSGQTRATVTKSILQEISIVDMGGNDNALKLYKDNGDDFEIEELNLKQPKNMNDLKTIALSLGLGAEATETEVLSAIATLKSDKDKAETELETLAQAEKDAKEEEAKKLITDASAKLKLEGDAKANFEKSQTALFLVDHANAKGSLEMLVSGLVKETPAKDDKSIALGKFMKDVIGDNNKGADATLSYDYLQKHNTVELKRIKNEEPETYAELVKNYAKGVRYTK